MLTLKKIKELKFKEKADVFELDYIGGYIIVNDDHTGINIFDNNLNLVKTLYIAEHIVIGQILHSINENDILLWCPLSESAVLVSLQDFSYKIMSLGREMEDVYLSSTYSWRGDVIILATAFLAQFYKIDTKKLKISEIKFDDIQNIDPLLTNFINRERNKEKIGTIVPLTIKTNANKQEFIFKYSSKEKTCSYNFVTKKLYCCDHFGMEYFDIVSCDNVFAFLEGNYITLYVADSKMILGSKNGFEPFKLAFIDCSTIVVLSRRISNRLAPYLTMYRIAGQNA